MTTPAILPLHVISDGSNSEKADLMVGGALSLGGLACAKSEAFNLDNAQRSRGKAGTASSTSAVVKMTSQRAEGHVTDRKTKDTSSHCREA
jgi:hypothetical protein